MRFSSTPINDVATELERVYNCSISFAEGQVFKNMISGEHDNKSLGVKLRIEVARNVHELIEKLLAGKGDLIARCV